MDVFSTLLQQLVSHLPGSRGAVFVDGEGEAVGKAGEDPDAAMIMGAHWGVVYSLLQRSLARLGQAPSRGVVLGFGDRQVAIEAVDDGYLVVCDADRVTSPGQVRSICRHTAELLREEM